MSTKNKGNYYEDLAVEYLLKKGYSILDRNYRYSRVGEIDIIAQMDGALYIVEVKGRASSTFGRPSEAVTPAKLNKLRSTALAYLREKELFYKQIHFSVLEAYHEKGEICINFIEDVLD